MRRTLLATHASSTLRVPSTSTEYSNARFDFGPGVTMAAIDLLTEGLATSGDYERYIEIDGQRFCHILDPRTGWPTPHWQSVSVVAPVCGLRS